MDEKRHTPGPWLITEDNSMVYVLDDVPGFYVKGRQVQGNRFSASLHVHPRLGEASELVANAHLIAAAPDLLESLEELVEVLKRQVPMPDDKVMPDSRMGKAIAAIAKAKGL